MKFIRLKRNVKVTSCMNDILGWILAFVGFILILMFINSVGKRSRFRGNYDQAKSLGADLTGIQDPDEMDSTTPERIWTVISVIGYIAFWAIVAIAIFIKTKEFLTEVLSFNDVASIITVSFISAVVVFLVVWLYRILTRSFAGLRVDTDKDTGVIDVVEVDNKGIYMKVFLFILVVLVQIGLWNLAYDRGHEDGYQAGYESGHYVGKRKGYEEGYEEGYDEGKEICGL